MLKGETVKKLREKLNYTIKDLSNITKIHPYVLTKIEAGHPYTLSVFLLCSLARGLKIRWWEMHE